MLIELTPQQRHDQEVALPQIWDDGFHPQRIDWYTRLTVESEIVLGGQPVITEFIAAMIAESSLNNRAFGDANPDVHFGVGWCQLDTGYHVANLDFLLDVRLDPLVSLEYVTNTSDLSKTGRKRTQFNRQRWHAWEPHIIDPPEGVWSPLQAAEDAWERIT